MPYRLLPGFQVVPSRNLRGPISKMVGRPFANKKMQISATARMEMHAQAVNTPCMTISFRCEVVVFIFLYSPVFAQELYTDGFQKTAVAAFAAATAVFFRKKGVY